MKNTPLCIVFIFVLILCLQSITVFSQQYTFINYSVDEGLAQSQVYAMCEDDNGNMWFGTRGGGLSRFDGITFKNYTVQEGLISNYIRCLHKDISGNLWVGTDNGLAVYNGKAFSSYTTKQGLDDVVINDIAEDSKGTIWIATETGIYYIQKERVMSLTSENGAAAERINCLLFDAAGTLWAGSENGLYGFTPYNSKWNIKHFTTGEGLPNNSITALVPRRDGGIWICTYGGGVAAFHKNTFLSITKSDGLANNTVFDCIDIDSSEVVWFCTASGITKYNPAKTDFPFTQITETEGLAKNVVMCTLKDSFGNLWFGTSGGGVSKLSSERFIHFTSIKGVFGTSVYAIFQDRTGLMWFATSEGGVTTYDGKVYKRFSERNGFTASKVKCMQQDSAGNIWLGTIADGVYLYNGKTFRRFSTKNGLSSNFINYILIDASHTVWLATAGGGISCLFPAANGTYKVKNIRPRDGLGSDRINTLAEDYLGNIWAGTAAHGISKIQYSKEKRIFTITNQNRTNGLPSNNIRCSFVDPHRRTIILGTSDAGLIANDGTHTFSFTTRNGLSSNNIYSCILDTEGNWWIGTDKGIDKVSLYPHITIEKVRHYGKSEGFTGIETMQNAVCLDSAGQVWFGTVKSATVFNPAAERGLKTPKVHISGMHLFFDAIEKTVYGKNITAWYSLPQNLVLPYDQNHVSFDVIGVEQSNPDAVRYKWMLEGFDERWSPATDRREAVYSNLPPGNYTFKVIAANERGEWSGTPTAYTFTIRPPFWQTWWFILLALAVIGLIVWWIAATSLRKLKQENEREKQRLEAERALIELEQKALRLQMNPHFLFNCLNSIKGLIAEDKPEEAKIYLSKFAKLMRSMLDHSMETFISLEKEIAGLQVYADLEKLSRDESFEFTIEVEPSIDPSFTQIPPMLVQPFVENSILHGMSGKEGKGEISVRFTQEENYLRCIIEDNGIGREKAAELKLNSMQQHKSAAITVTQERLNILNKKLNLEAIKISVTDLKDEQHQASGTRVTVLIPFQQ